jgi:hypothetical protein
MAHQLRIQIDDILHDANYIMAIDWSIYDAKLPLTNRVMKVDIPGEPQYALVPFTASGRNSYSSKSLKLSKQITHLPDGLWVFTYSICPNERKFTQVSHFRCVQLQNSIYAGIAKLMGTRHYTPEIQGLLATCLLNIKALKANTIDQYNIQKAYDLYSDTERIYNNINKTIENAL